MSNRSEEYVLVYLPHFVLVIVENSMQSMGEVAMREGDCSVVFWMVQVFVCDVLCDVCTKCTCMFSR